MGKPFRQASRSIQHNLNFDRVCIDNQYKKPSARKKNSPQKETDHFEKHVLCY